MDCEDVEVLALEKILSKRLFLEVCYISKTVNPLNNCLDIKSLSIIYNYLLYMEQQKLHASVMDDTDL